MIEPHLAILSRRPDESIILGDDLVLTVVDVSPARATLRVTRESDARTLWLRLYDEHESGVEVNVVLVEVAADRARLLVSAPRSISIHRLEVYEAIREENQRGTPG